jgi:hypothetical protein
MAKSDPLMRFVYMRHRTYRPYYPAHSTPFRKNGRCNSAATGNRGRKMIQTIAVVIAIFGAVLLAVLAFAPSPTLPNAS